MPPPVVARALALLSTAAIAVLLLIPLPVPAEGLGPPESDKAVHVVLFGGLALVWAYSLRPAGGVRLAALAAAVTLYGGVLELLQALTPYRSCDWRDFLADASGAVLATVVWRALGGLRAWQTRTRD